MKVALYVRVSTQRQQQTQTIEQQLQRLRVHVAEHSDWMLSEAHIYQDDGYSGASLNRPGLDRLRDAATMSEFEVLWLTAPDRLARKYAHQVFLLESLQHLGIEIQFLDRPINSADPHDQLLLQMRGVVAEYERSLIVDRMRRGRQAKLRSGQLLPWSQPAYGYLPDAESPRDPQRLQLDPIKSRIVEQIFSWYVAVEEPMSLYTIARRLDARQIPTPQGAVCWNTSSLAKMLGNPAYAGIAYAGRKRQVKTQRRQSALKPPGPGLTRRPTDPDEWIPIPVPAIVSQETFEKAQQRMQRNQQLARRNNHRHDYLLRGLISCSQCQLAWVAQTRGNYGYYHCTGRGDRRLQAQNRRCTVKDIRTQWLDELVFQDLSAALIHPEIMTHQLQRAQSGQWLPQLLQSRIATLQESSNRLQKQKERLLELYLAEMIGRDEFERKRQQLEQTHQGFEQQLQQLQNEAKKQINLMAFSKGIEDFCQRTQQTLPNLNFQQRRQLVELLIDRVLVDDQNVEIRYVIPTSPKGENIFFYQLRLPHFTGGLMHRHDSWLSLRFFGDFNPIT